MSLKDELNENLFVFTRDKDEDYHFYFIGDGYEYKSLREIVSIMFSASARHNEVPYDSDIIVSKGSEGTLLMRGIIDGRRDNYGRLIVRVEGAILPPEAEINDEVKNTLIELFDEKQRETNNYNFGNQYYYSRKPHSSPSNKSKSDDDGDGDIDFK